MSLPDLSKSCLGKDLAITSKNSKAMSARVSYWKREELRLDQVIINVCFVYLLPPANEVSQVSVCHSVGVGVGEGLWYITCIITCKLPPTPGHQT